MTKLLVLWTTSYHVLLWSPIQESCSITESQRRFGRNYMFFKIKSCKIIWMLHYQLHSLDLCVIPKSIRKDSEAKINIGSSSNSIGVALRLFYNCVHSVIKFLHNETNSYFHTYLLCNWVNSRFTHTTDFNLPNVLMGILGFGSCM